MAGTYHVDATVLLRVVNVQGAKTSEDKILAWMTKKTSEIVGLVVDLLKTDNTVLQGAGPL